MRDKKCNKFDLPSCRRQQLKVQRFQSFQWLHHGREPAEEWVSSAILLQKIIEMVSESAGCNRRARCALYAANRARNFSKICSNYKGLLISRFIYIRQLILMRCKRVEQLILMRCKRVEKLIFKFYINWSKSRFWHVFCTSNQTAELT